MLKPILTLAAVGAIALTATHTLTAEAAGKGPTEAQKATLASCAGCHDITPARQALVGPPLYGIYGKKPQMGGVKFAKWDKKTLDAFLADPAKVKPTTTMPVSVEDKAERAAMVKALEGLK